MAFDMFAPEHHFDGDRIVKRKKDDGSNEVADFIVPLETFWRPINLGDHNVDPESEEAKYWKDYTTGPRPEQRGDFLAPAIMDHARPNFDEDSFTSGPARDGRSAAQQEDLDRDKSYKYKKYDKFDDQKSEKSDKFRPPRQEGINRLRKVIEEKRPNEMAFKKFTNPSFAREAEHMADLTRTLYAKA